jgi:hypothetical protein
MARITIPSKHSNAYTDQVADFSNERQTDVGFVAWKSALYGQGSRCLLVSRQAGCLNHIIAATDDMAESERTGKFSNQNYLFFTSSMHATCPTPSSLWTQSL